MWYIYEVDRLQWVAIDSLSEGYFWVFLSVIPPQPPHLMYFMPTITQNSIISYHNRYRDWDCLKGRILIHKINDYFNILGTWTVSNLFLLLQQGVLSLFWYFKYCTCNYCFSVPFISVFVLFIMKKNWRNGYLNNFGSWIVSDCWLARAQLRHQILLASQFVTKFGGDRCIEKALANLANNLANKFVNKFANKFAMPAVAFYTTIIF